MGIGVLEWGCKMKKIIPVVIIVVILLCVGYGAGALFFSDKFLPQTTINDIPFGGKDVDYVKQKIDKISHDKLLITAKDNMVEEILLSDIKYTEAFDLDNLSNIKEDQTSLLWPVKMLGKKNYEIIPIVEYDASKLESIVENLDIISGNAVVSPKDAYIKFENGAYQLVPEVVGNKINLSMLKDIINNAVSRGVLSINLEEKDCYIYPKIYSDSKEIKETIEKLDKLKRLSLIYDFDDRQVTVMYDTFSPWLVYENGKLTVDEPQVRKFIEGLARDYDTLRTNRQFKTTNFGEMTMGGGNYGWQTDIATSTAQLIEAINAAESKTIQPAYTTYGFSRKTDDIGNTYVEIDLTTQYMWYYVDGNILVETPIVSGLPTTERETPTGIFKLLSRETKRYLTGEDYKLWVEYWLPITWAGVGIHDAYWQTTFGGDRYLTHGSHGCLNTPFDKVKIIFDNIKVGTPVLVYKSIPVPEDQAPQGDAVESGVVDNLPNTAEQSNINPNAQAENTPQNNTPGFEYPVENNEPSGGVQFEYPVESYD